MLPLIGFLSDELKQKSQDYPTAARRTVFIETIWSQYLPMCFCFVKEIIYDRSGNVMSLDSSKILLIVIHRIG